VGLRFGSGPAADSDGRAAELLRLARSGDRGAREELIRSYTPFILKTAARVARRYLEPGRDDEVSVALMAFNEAIDQFDGGGYARFIGFARLVIRRRLVDYYRRCRRKEVPLSALEGEDEGDKGPSAAEVRDALERHQWEVEAADRREEIERYQQALSRYGITLADLVAESPGHAPARDRAQEVARTLAQDPDMLQHLLSSGTLPLAELCRRVAVSRKTVERHRRYIIAVAVIIAGDFPELYEYIRPKRAPLGAGGGPGGGTPGRR